MIYDLKFGKKVKCSKKEIKQCIIIVEKLINFAEKARREGLLALEDDIEELYFPFFQRGLQLVVDGTDPEIIRNILELQIFSGNYKGKELLYRCIVLEGVLSIQAGDNPRIVQEKLLSFFDDKYHKLIKEKKVNFHYEYLKKIKGKKVLSDKTAILEELIDIDDRSIQKILREIDSRELTLALSGASGKLQNKIFKNMSERAVNLICEDIMYISPIPEKYIVESQKKIINIMKKLIDMGEIYIEKNK